MAAAGTTSACAQLSATSPSCPTNEEQSENVQRVLYELVANAKTARSNWRSTDCSESSEVPPQNAASWYQTDGSPMRSWRRLLLITGARCVEVLESTFIAIATAAAVEALISEGDAITRHLVSGSSFSKGADAEGEEEVREKASRHHRLRRHLEQQCLRYSSPSLAEPWIHVDASTTTASSSAPAEAPVLCDASGAHGQAHRDVVLLYGTTKMGDSAALNQRKKEGGGGEEENVESLSNRLLRSLLHRVAAHLALLLLPVMPSSIPSTLSGPRSDRVSSHIQPACDLLDEIQQGYNWQSSVSAATHLSFRNGESGRHLVNEEAEPATTDVKHGSPASHRTPGEDGGDASTHPSSHVNVFRSLLYADTP